MGEARDPAKPFYIGDGVFVNLNSRGQIVLRTDRGTTSREDVIYLEPEVYEELLAWHGRVVAKEGGDAEPDP